MGKKKKSNNKTLDVRVTTDAFENINEIIRYIAIVNKQPLNAIKIGDLLFKTIDRIAQNPFAFRECELIPTKTKIYREAVCLSWKIIFKITVNDIIVLGILHGARKPSKFKALRKVK